MTARNWGMRDLFAMGATCPPAVYPQTSGTCSTSAYIAYGGVNKGGQTFKSSPPNPDKFGETLFEVDMIGVALDKNRYILFFIGPAEGGTQAALA